MSSITAEQLSETVRSLIAEGKLEDAANTLLQHLEQVNAESSGKDQFIVYSQALQLVSQLNELKSMFIQGIITHDEANLKRNKIRMALVEITEGLKAPKTTPAPPNSSGQNSKNKIWIGIAVVVVAGLLIWFIANKFMDPGVQKAGQNGIEITDMPSKIKPKDLSVAPTSTEKITEPVEKPASSDSPTGCFIKTSLLTGLQKNPEIMGQPFMDLPQNTEFKVIEVHKEKFVNTMYYFFKIKHGKYTGWVKQVECDFVSPDCLE